VSLALVVTTVLIHYEVLRAASRLIPRLSIPLRTRILVVIAVAFVAHLLEIGLYALAFFLMDHQFGLGSIEGATEGGALDFFYFSITTYTTMGFGDLSPHGPLRVVAGVEGIERLTAHRVVRLLHLSLHGEGLGGAPQGALRSREPNRLTATWMLLKRCSPLEPIVGLAVNSG
jgi:hypothetical protein